MNDRLIAALILTFLALLGIAAILRFGDRWNFVSAGRCLTWLSAAMLVTAALAASVSHAGQWEPPPLRDAGFTWRVTLSLIWFRFLLPPPLVVGSSVHRRTLPFLCGLLAVTLFVMLSQLLQGFLWRVSTPRDLVATSFVTGIIVLAALSLFILRYRRMDSEYTLKNENSFALSGLRHRFFALSFSCMVSYIYLEVVNEVPLDLTERNLIQWSTHFLLFGFVTCLIKRSDARLDDARASAVAK